MLTRWEPFRELMSLREAMDRLFEESFVHPRRLLGVTEVGEVALDLYQTEDEVVAKATYEHGVLTVSIPKAEGVKVKPVKVQVKQTVEGKKA